MWELFLIYVIFCGVPSFFLWLLLKAGTPDVVQINERPAKPSSSSVRVHIGDNYHIHNVQNLNLTAGSRPHLSRAKWNMNGDDYSMHSETHMGNEHTPVDYLHDDLIVPVKEEESTRLFLP